MKKKNPSAKSLRSPACVKKLESSSCAPAQAQTHEALIQPLLKLRLKSKDGVYFMGPGPASLLEAIDQEGSVRLAAKRLGLSYSKAWQILQRIENVCEEAPLETIQGGSGGGHSSLTAFGRALLLRYRAFEAAVSQDLKQHFAHFFPAAHISSIYEDLDATTSKHEKVDAIASKSTQSLDLEAVLEAPLNE